MIEIRKNLASMFLGQISKIILGFISGIILARALSSDDRGIYAILLVVPTLLSLVFSFGFPQINSIFTGKYKEQRFFLLKVNFVLIIISSILITFLFFISGKYELLSNSAIGQLSFQSRIVMLLISICMLINILIREFVKGCNNIYAISKALSIESIVVFLGFLFCYLYELSLEWFFCVQLIANLIVACYLFNKSMNIVSKIEKKGTNAIGISHLTKNAMVYYLGSLSIAIALHSPTILMNGYELNLTDIACFAIAYSLLQQIEVIPTAVVNVLLPELSNSNESESPVDSIVKVCKFTMFVYVFLTLLAYFFIKIIYIPIIGSQYYEVHLIFFCLMIGGWFGCCGKIINVYFNLVNKSSFDTSAVLVRSIIQLALSVLLINLYGVYGIVLAIVISRIARMFVTYTLFVKLTGVHYSSFLISRSDVIYLYSKFESRLHKLRKE